MTAWDTVRLLWLLDSDVPGWVPGLPDAPAFAHKTGTTTWRLPALYGRFGYRVRIFPGCAQSTGYLAGDDSVRLAGVLDAVAGFVLGSFTEAESPDALLREFLLPLGQPVLGGWPSGHGTPNLQPPKENPPADGPLPAPTARSTP